MNRLKTFCGCCEQMVELYSDHLIPPGGATHRCGNCFEPYFEDDVAKAATFKSALDAHDAKRSEMIRLHRGGV